MTRTSRTSRTTRTSRTNTYTPAATEVVTAEAKAMSGVANAETLAERRARRNKTAYNSKLSQAVIAETAVKGGAAATVKETAVDVAQSYGRAGKQFAKLAVADKAVAELMALMPQSKTKTFLKRVPFIGGMIENREEVAVKGLLVTVVPFIATIVADHVESDRVATALFNVSDTMADMGARDGISATTSFLSPKLVAFWEAMTSEADASQETMTFEEYASQEA